MASSRVGNSYTRGDYSVIRIGDILPVGPSEGVIIEWSLNGLFHDTCDAILTSQTNVREMEDNDNEPMLGTQIKCHKSFKGCFLTTLWLKTLEKVILMTFNIWNLKNR